MRHTGRFGGGGRIIDLGGWRQMRNDPVAEQVFAYWEALRGPARAPDRARLDPDGLEGALDRIAIAEEIAPGLGRMRLAGLRYAGLLGMEVRGMPVSALVQVEDRARLAGLLDRVFATAAVAELTVSAAEGPGRPGLSGGLLMLPLADARRGRRLALLLLSLPGEIGEAPRRLRIAGARLRPIAGEMPEPPAPQPAPLPAPGLAEPPARFRPARRPALRIVEGGLPER